MKLPMEVVWMGFPYTLKEGTEKGLVTGLFKETGEEFVDCNTVDQIVSYVDKGYIILEGEKK